MTRREPPVDPPEMCPWHPPVYDGIGHLEHPGYEKAGCPACYEEWEASQPDTIKEAEGWA